jgi:hypothetical protein
VLLEELALAGQLGVADGDPRAVGVEPLQDLARGEGTGLVEAGLDRLLAVEPYGTSTWRTKADSERATMTAGMATSLIEGLG